MKTLMESLLYFVKALLSALKNVRPSFGRVCFHHIRIQTELIEALVFVLSEKFHSLLDTPQIKLGESINFIKLSCFEKLLFIATLL